MQTFLKTALKPGAQLLITFEPTVPQARPEGNPTVATAAGPPEL